MGEPAVDAERLIARLERFGDTLPAVVGDLRPPDARWRSADGAWSILEIVTHLADEEVEDFRPRLRLTLDTPAEPWPPIDPEGWAVEHRYNEGDLAEALGRFQTERRASVQWLRGLGPAASVDWRATHAHPRLGSMRAGDLLVAWVAHDYLHLRQISKRMYQMTQDDGGEYEARYAGAWTS